MTAACKTCWFNDGAYFVPANTITQSNQRLSPREWKDVVSVGSDAVSRYSKERGYTWEDE